MKNVLIMGAGGRDFHNFNILFRDNPEFRVCCFTWGQLPIRQKRYLHAGRLYPEGIPIYPESGLEKLIKQFGIQLVVFSYSDISYQELFKLASRVAAAGCAFWLPGTETMLPAEKPVIAVTATRTGAGKSSLTRFLVRLCLELQVKPTVIRHPMPYIRQDEVKVFRKEEDLSGHTFEEMEEILPLLDLGIPVLTGTDTRKTLKKAEALGDLVIWDGGNNDFPFIRPNLWITVIDSERPGLDYWPSRINLEKSQVLLINKARKAGKLERAIKAENPRAETWFSDFKIEVEGKLKKGTALLIDDFPSLTHGRSQGLAIKIARKYRIKPVDPRKWLPELYQKYSLPPVLPTYGYTQKQISAFYDAVKKIPADFILTTSPIPIKPGKPVVRIRYELKPQPGFKEMLEKRITKLL